MYRSQHYGTAVYQAELAWRLKALGYEIESGKNHAPEIKGYTKEYLEASSPRSQQINAHLEEHGLEGAGAAQIAAHRTRDSKGPLGAEEILARHREVAARYGNQADRVVAEARDRAERQELHRNDESASARYAQEGVTWARDRHMEREAVVDERTLMRDALRRSMGRATFEKVRENFDQRIRSGEFIEVEQGRAGVAERSFTTRQMIELERENVALMKAGQERFFDPMVLEYTLERMEDKFARLSYSQGRAVEEILASQDKIVGLEGTAGSGKTTTLAFIREAAVREGYHVEGFAPTSRAAQQLEEAGIRSSTLQRHLARGRQGDDRERHLYFVDESSLASTKQVNQFLHRLHDRDHVIFVGDIRQHQGVEAGRPFKQLQEAGVRTTKLAEIIRQKDPALKDAVEQLARGEVREAIENLKRQGRMHEIVDRDERLKAIAKEFAAHPGETLVVSPDNRSRHEISRLIHQELQATGMVEQAEYSVTVLTARQEMTGADRQWAAQYEVDDMVRYTKGSRIVSVEAGEYVRVVGNSLRSRRRQGSRPLARRLTPPLTAASLREEQQPKRG